MTLDQYEFATVDFGRSTNLKFYNEDKATLFAGTGYTGVIQGFKRRSDGTFYYWNDVTRGIAVSGFGAQVVSDIDIVFEAPTVGSNTITNEGTAPYTSVPTVTFSGGSPTRNATGIAVLQDGKVIDIIMTDRGSKFTSVPTIAFSGGGTGAGAAATAILDTGENHGTFAFTESNLANIPGYLWLKAVLSKGGTEVISSKFVRVFVEFGSPS